MPHPDRLESILRALIFGTIALIAVGLILFLKKSSDVPLSPEHAARRDSLSRIATPDTTAAPELTPALHLDDNSAADDDSLATDTRIPSDAGYEDGYFAGLEDGVTGDERLSYDETSQFPTAAQRRNYAEAYRRGYAQGYEDGQAGKDMPTDGSVPPHNGMPRCPTTTISRVMHRAKNREHHTNLRKGSPRSRPPLPAPHNARNNLLPFVASSVKTIFFLDETNSRGLFEILKKKCEDFSPKTLTYRRECVLLQSQ